LYTGPVGSGKVAQQIHDYNVHVDSNDVFWMIRVVPSVVAVNFTAGQASLRMSGLNVFDDHDIANSLTDGLGLPGDLGFPYPAIPPVPPVRATVSFDVEWNGAVAMAQVHNDAQRFQGTFLSTEATINWSAEQDGFLFQSEAPNPARNLISVLGNEQNGVFFS
jgi:hypothetical protein